MQRTVVWLAAFSLVACSDRRPVDLTAPRLSPESVTREVVVTDPDPTYGVTLSSTLFGTPVFVGAAQFGQQVTSTPGYVLDARVVRTPAGSTISSDFIADDGCTPFTSSDIAGNIVLIDRGTCSFATKALNAENAGAIGVIIRDNSFIVVPPRMAPDGVNTVSIPTFSISRANGGTLRNAILLSGEARVQLVVIPVDPPTLHLPDDITTNATSSAGAMVTLVVPGTTYRNQGGVSCSAPASRFTFPIGTTTVTCSSIDIWNNSVSGSFNVIVRPLDTTPPTISGAQDVTVELTSPAGAIAYYGPVTAIDDGQVVAVNCSQPSGSLFPFGSTTVTCVATDAAGNSAVATFTVNVVDTSPPVITLPPNVTTDATSSAGALVNYAVTATDNSGSATVSCSPSSGATFAIGTTTVTCLAHDDRGNASSGAFTVTVKGANAQIADLLKSVGALDLQDGIETSVQTKLTAALNALNTRNVVDACGSLGALINQINAQTGKKISLADAQTLIATVQRIRSAAGC